MATLTVQAITDVGVTPTYAAATALGDEFVNNGKIFIHVKNADGAVTRAVTVTSQTNCNQGVQHDAVVTVAISAEEMIGPFPTNRWNDSDSKVQITYDDEAQLTIAAISMNP